MCGDSTFSSVAALIDSGEGDFMLETAMLKVFSTEVLWKIINDTFGVNIRTPPFMRYPDAEEVRNVAVERWGILDVESHQGMLNL
jgi:hypothetical protein